MTYGEEWGRMGERLVPAHVKRLELFDLPNLRRFEGRFRVGGCGGVAVGWGGGVASPTFRDDETSRGLRGGLGVAERVSGKG